MGVVDIGLRWSGEPRLELWLGRPWRWWQNLHFGGASVHFGLVVVVIGGVITRSGESRGVWGRGTISTDDVIESWLRKKFASLVIE